MTEIAFVLIKACKGARRMFDHRSARRIHRGDTGKRDVPPAQPEKTWWVEDVGRICGVQGVILLVVLAGFKTRQQFGEPVDPVKFLLRWAIAGFVIAFISASAAGIREGIRENQKNSGE